MVDSLEKLCLASVSDEGVGNIRVPAACVNDPVLLKSIQAIVASYQVKSGNALSNGDHRFTLRWKDGELIGVRVEDDVVITREGLKNSETRARELSR